MHRYKKEDLIFS